MHGAVIRPETAADVAVIRQINTAAFGRADEARLVEELRKDGAFTPAMSQLAYVDGDAVGHILFSRLEVSGVERTFHAAALAPLAVLPQMQDIGIGGQLVRNGIAQMAAADYQLLVVLGEPSYYERFGFSIALGRQVQCSYSGQHLMALALEEAILAPTEIVDAFYARAFAGL